MAGQQQMKLKQVFLMSSQYLRMVVSVLIQVLAILEMVCTKL